MKAILVVDMPKSCADCNLRLFDTESVWYNMCMPTLKEDNCVSDSYKECEDLSKIPSWCPLKPIPEKNTWDITKNGHVTEYAEGWNACLEEIEK